MNVRCPATEPEVPLVLPPLDASSCTEEALPWSGCDAELRAGLFFLLAEPPWSDVI